LFSQISGNLTVPWITGCSRKRAVSNLSFKAKSGFPHVVSKNAIENIIIIFIKLAKLNTDKTELFQKRYFEIITFMYITKLISNNM
jgi:hypothetical protein